MIDVEGARALRGMAEPDLQALLKEAMLAYLNATNNQEGFILAFNEALQEWSRDGNDDPLSWADKFGNRFSPKPPRPERRALNRRK